MQRDIKVLGLFKAVGKNAQLFSDNGVQHGVAVSDRLVGANHAELEFVAGECKRRGAVTVGVVTQNMGQRVHTNAHFYGVLVVQRSVGLNGVQHFGKVIANKHRNNGRGGFVGTQTVVVARRGDRDAQQVLILVYALDDSGQEQQELCVLAGAVARLQQVGTAIGRNRPVVMFAAAVNAGKGLFVQQTN
ncbi:hypothetical protein SDC9_123062 [bioreactor metagenome]|uniref:Uncharacterized protein n=1 Tax=bioreactor metagenome TaxID=1076179 RepID=A0A645CGI8_9ZZZZ